MADQNIKVRHIQKHDTEENWNKAVNFIPKQGEIIIYDIDSNYSYERMKIGDGTTLVSSLPFIDAQKQDKLTFDDIPTADSTNPVTSGGVKTYVDTKVAESSNIDETAVHYKGEIAGTSLPATPAFGDVWKVGNDITISGQSAISTYVVATSENTIEFDGDPSSAVVIYPGTKFTAILNSDETTKTLNCTVKYTKVQHFSDGTTPSFVCIYVNEDISTAFNITSYAQISVSSLSSNSLYVKPGDLIVYTYSGWQKFYSESDTLKLERLKYYGDPDIVPSDESYFTVNETGETITGLTDMGKTQTELVIPYRINGVEITNLQNDNYTSILSGNSVITKVVIPNSVISIGEGTFEDCRSLTSVNIPNSVTSIGYYAFSDCTSLTSINIPNSVTNIGWYTFEGCTSLTSIHISDSVTSIGNVVFSSCTALTSIHIPNSVTSIGTRAFYNCSSLTSIYIPNSVTSIETDVLYMWDDTSEYNVPISGLTIYCEQGSYAETYANTNTIPVMYTDISATDFNNKADKATTLGGYGITDAYTKGEIDSKISNVYEIKGSSTVANLPTNPEVGDVYNIIDSGTITGTEIVLSTGDNVVYTSDGWDKLSATIDLSGYQEKLTFDNTPTADSTNPVTSEGIKTALDGKLDKTDAVGQKTSDGGEIFNVTSLNTAGNQAHAEGIDTHATGMASHTEGQSTYATSSYAHAEGHSTHAEGEASHVEGEETVVKTVATSAHAEGNHTIASKSYQHVQGKYNIEDTTTNGYAHIVGNGSDSLNRSNAHTLDWNGNAWYAGDIKVGGISYDDENAKTLVTKTELDKKQDINTITKVEQEYPQYGDELLNSTDWTLGTGWSGDLENGFTHASGSTEPLTFTMSSTETKLFRICFNSSVALTDTNLLVSIGNSDFVQLYGQPTPIIVGIQSVSDGNLIFSPASNYTGTVTITSVKEIVGFSNPVSIITDSNDRITSEYRYSDNTLRNVFIGKSVGQYNDNGRENVGVGSEALSKNISGFWNVGLGRNALQNNTAGSRNIAIGYIALQQNTIGCRNIAIGSFALNHNTNGSWNIGIGADCLDHNTEGKNNVAVGFSSMYLNTTGEKNTSVGSRSLNNITTGGNNVAIGYSSGAGIKTGDGNMAIGYGSMSYLSSGSYNVAIGMNSLFYTVGGSQNVAIGQGAGDGGSNNNIRRNVFIGANTGAEISGTSERNVIVGFNSGNSLTTGNRNIIIGAYCEVGESVNDKLNIGDLITGDMTSNSKSVTINGRLAINDLPTSTPSGANQLWNDNGVVRVNDGAEVKTIMTSDNAYSKTEIDELLNNKAKKPVFATVAIPTTGWTTKQDSNNEDYYELTLDVANVTAEGQSIIDVAFSDDIAVARTEKAAYQCVDRCVVNDGNVTLYCFDELPTTAFTLRIQIIY